MSRQNLIKNLKDKNPKLNNAEIEEIINCFSNCVKNALKQGRNIELRGFGTFSKKYIRPRKFINPKTKKVSYLGETATIHFKPSKKLTKIL